jgi:hypothetical protein
MLDMGSPVWVDANAPVRHWWQGVKAADDGFNLQITARPQRSVITWNFPRDLTSSATKRGVDYRKGIVHVRDDLPHVA